VLDGFKYLLFGAILIPHAYGDAPKTLKACTVVWSPFVTSEGGVFAGSDTKVLQEAVQKLGYTDLKIEDVPWKRCLKMAEEGTVDIVYPASKNTEREAYLHYPKMPLHPVSYVFVTKVGSAEGWTTKKDVSSLPQPIGIPLGYSVAEQLHKESGAQFDETSKDDQVNMQKLVLGRVGTIIIEKMNGLDLMKQLNVADKLTILNQPYEGKDYYVTVSKKSPNAQALIEGLNKILPELVPKNAG
jgi:polar amino acid transport system substrate-binding protein